MDDIVYAKAELKSADSVNVLHTNLMEVLREHLTIGDKADIRNLPSQSDANWERTSSREIEFYLVDPVSREISRRDRGNAVAVFPVACMSELWVSWYEKWKVPNRGRFVLCAVSLTFWAGPVGAEKKEQLIRAEWDHHAHAAQGSGQPHWQIDHPVGIKYGVESVQEGLSESRLEELSSESLAWYDISSYHLGMRGDWTTSGAAKRGWQNRWADDGGDLHRWLNLCLEYLISQVRSYPAIRV